MVTPSPALPRVLVLAAHPSLHLSHVNLALMKAAATLPHVRVRDLYALYPDYLIDVAAEQAAAAEADLIVWQHPVHWYGMPPMMKLWLDEVLTVGWAYGQGGTSLRGKDLWLALSTGGSEAAYHPQGYNRYLFEAFLPPYEQTAALCGLRFLPPMVLHGSHHLAQGDLEDHVQTFVDRLQRYPDWPELDELPECPACTVPGEDRPAPIDEV
jgi:glutathione-regulated potassium-efflux system ancillary protein KefF